MKQTNKPKEPGLLSKIAEAADLPVSAVSKEPRIEVSGNRQMTVENHIGLLEYEPSIIRINCGKIIISVAGTDLNIKVMNNEELFLTGFITSIEYNA